jgi:hypothetical protein
MILSAAKLGSALQEDEACAYCGGITMLSTKTRVTKKVPWRLGFMRVIGDAEGKYVRYTFDTNIRESVPPQPR